MLKRLVLSVVLVVLLGAAGGAAFLYHRNHRPMALAERALTAGNPRDAIIELRNASRDAPQDPNVQLLLAKAHALTGDLVAAERDLKRARALGADRSAIAGQLAVFYLSERRFKDILAETPATGPTPDVTARNLALRGRAYLGLDDKPAAIEALTAALKLAPENPEVLATAARLDVAQNDRAGAETKLEAALAADPTNVDALLLKSQLLGAKGDAAGALATVSRAVAAAPAFPAPRLARANLFLLSGDIAKARQDLGEVLSMQPRNATALYLDGVASIREERWAEAAQKFQLLGPAASRFPRAAYFQAQAAIGQNLPSSAVDFATRYTSDSPGDPDGVRLLARAQAVNRRTDLAIATLTDAIRRGLSDAETFDQLGNAYIAEGNAAAAIEAYNNALGKSPGNPVIQLHLARAQVEQGNAGQAVAGLDATDLATAQPDRLQALTTALIAAGDLVKAAAALEQLRAVGGRAEQVAILTGMLALANFDPEQAIVAFTAAIAANPGSTIARLDLAKALVLAGRRDEARAIWTDILAKDPANLAALNSFVQSEVDLNRFPPAIRVLEAAAAAAPKNDGILAMLADVLVRTGVADRAVETLTRARTASEMTPILLAARARALVAANRAPEADALYRETLESNADPQTALEFAALQQKQQNIAGAKATIDAAIARTPGNFALLTQRVQLEAASGQEAASRLAAAFALDPRQGSTAAVLPGDALMRAGRPADAAKAFRAASEKMPSPSLALRLAEAQLAAGDEAGAMETLRPLPQDPGAALLRSQVAIHARKWPDAARELELALRGRPMDPGLLNNLAFAYQAVGDPRARVTAQRAYLASPNPDTADTLGWIILQQNAAAALPFLQLAAQQRPQDPDIAFHLALALEKTGKGAEAVKLLKAALADAKAFENRADAQALLTRLGG